MVNAPLIEWDGECLIAYVELPAIGCLRFNKFGDHPWYAEGLELDQGDELAFSDASIGADAKLARILDAALERLPWAEPCRAGCTSLRAHAEHLWREEEAEAEASLRAQGYLDCRAGGGMHKSGEWCHLCRMYVPQALR